MQFVTISAKRLADAGHPVTPTNIPGLWDIAGIANDVTTNQLHQIADERGAPWSPWDERRRYITIVQS